MNKTYRLKWNHATQRFVVVSELAKTDGKTNSCRQMVGEVVKPVSYALSTTALALLFSLGATPLYATSQPVNEVADSLVVADQKPTKELNTVENEEENSEETKEENLNTAQQPVSLNAEYQATPYRAGRDGYEVGGANANGNTASTAIGVRATAIGIEATVIGVDAKANEGSVAIGMQSKGIGGNNVALGNKASATGNQSVALGANTDAAGHSSIAIGGDDINDLAKMDALKGELKNLTGIEIKLNDWQDTKAHGHGSIAFGMLADTSGDLGISIGTMSKVTALTGIAIGVGANATQKGAVALGGVLRPTIKQKLSLN